GCWPTGSARDRDVAPPSTTRRRGTDEMLVDSHCHLDAPEFDFDSGDVIARARTAGVARQVIPAIGAAGWPKLRDLCAGSEGLFPAYGLHPMFLDDHRPAHLVQLRDWIAREQP